LLCETGAVLPQFAQHDSDTRGLTRLFVLALQ
jgi:hypothetical protein